MSGNLLIKYISQPQRLAIVSDLISQLDHGSSDDSTVADICELVDHEYDWSHSAAAIQQYCDECLDSLQIDSLIKLSQSFRLLHDHLLARILLKLGHYLVAAGVLPQQYLQAKYQSVAASSRLEIATYLVLAEALLRRNPESPSLELIVLALYSVRVADEDISNNASGVVRWIIAATAQHRDLDENVWGIVFLLITAEFDFLNNNGYVLWIRYLTHLSGSAYYDGLVEQQQYWTYLQQLLVNETHQYRKYGLTIIQLLVQLLTASFSNSIMAWDAAEHHQYIELWKRYCTLYEIIGIDTALHQVEAGYSDIQSMLEPQSKIPVSWGLCLVSTGIKASMDSVRKYSLEIILNIKRPNLVIFDEHCSYFLTEVLLPYAIQGNLFTVTRSSVTAEEECVHGAKLADFIAHIFHGLSAHGKLHSVLVVALLILKKLVQFSQSYDHARMYVLMGLFRGLRGVRALGPEHYKVIFELVLNFSETDVLEKFCQTIYLRLVLSSAGLALPEYLRMLGQFVRANNGKQNTDNYGYLLLRDNLEFFLDFNSANYPLDAFLGVDLAELSVESKVVYLLMLSQRGQDVAGMLVQGSEFQLLLCELEFSRLPGFDGLDLDAAKVQVVQDLCSNCTRPAALWRRAGAVVEAELFDDENSWREIGLKKLWVSLNVEFQSADAAVIELAVAKLGFFARCYKKVCYFDESVIASIDDLRRFHGCLFKNLRQIKYQWRDQALTGYYTVFQTFMTVSDVREINMKVIEKDVSYISYNSQLQIMEVLDYLLVNHLDLVDLHTVAETLENVWSDLIDDRLKLNELKLHLRLIDVLCNPSLVEHPIVLGVLGDIVVQSSGRRSLLPRITRNLARFKLQNPDKFDTCSGLSDLLIQIFVLQRQNASLYKLDPIIARQYDQVINYGVGNIYQQVTGPEEVTSRVEVIAIIGSLSVSCPLAVRLFSSIIEDKKYHLFVPRKKVDHKEEWKRAQLFSILVVLTRLVPPELLFKHLGLFIAALESEASPWVRIYIEWLICLGHTNRPAEIDLFFDRLLAKDANPSVMNSYLRICYLICRVMDDLPTKTAYIKRLLAHLIPCSASSKVMIRHFASSLLCCVRNEVVAHNIPVSPETVEILNFLYQSIMESGRVDEYRNGDAMVWHPVADFTLVNICGGVLVKVSDRLDINYIPFEKFLVLSKQQVLRLGVPVGAEFADIFEGKRKPAKLLQLEHNTFDKVALQKKSGAWRTVLEDDTPANSNVQRGELIVMGSLVDKPPNLGGICRVCDVLGAKLLTIGDIKLKSHPHFKTVAVTADIWQPILEVRENSILDFMQEQKKNGYTLIGLEQTDKSVELNSKLVFPKKSLVVLGREKQGIPGDILAELDFCVEIKQVGVVRSMNIQTATAVFVHSYLVQHS